MVLADEPTAALDKKSGRDVVNIMQKLAKEQGYTVLLITHGNCKKAIKNPPKRGKYWI